MFHLYVNFADYFSDYNLCFISLLPVSASFPIPLPSWFKLFPSSIQENSLRGTSALVLLIGNLYQSHLVQIPRSQFLGNLKPSLQQHLFSSAVICSCVLFVLHCNAQNMSSIFDFPCTHTPKTILISHHRCFTPQTLWDLNATNSLLKKNKPLGPIISISP